MLVAVAKGSSKQGRPSRRWRRATQPSVCHAAQEHNAGVVAALSGGRLVFGASAANSISGPEHGRDGGSARRVLSGATRFSRYWQILLQESFCTADQKFFWL
jgi:hypothetical protein